MENILYFIFEKYSSMHCVILTLQVYLCIYASICVELSGVVYGKNESSRGPDPHHSWLLIEASHSWIWWPCSLIPYNPKFLLFFFFFLLNFSRQPNFVLSRNGDKHMILDTNIEKFIRGEIFQPIHKGRWFACIISWHIVVQSLIDFVTCLV